MHHSSGLSKSDIPEVQSHIENSIHECLYITVLIDPQKFEFVKQVLDSEPCLPSCSSSVHNSIIYRLQEKNKTPP
ncbi:hypothetical protein ACJMK2_014351 [Sinanodonta woodiana]|uniref:Uncharacterized protein n=1 Tax=Sinanodonta woodiana TaxID=1069815 RepID=A0ABD3V0G3_SINWO